MGAVMARDGPPMMQTMVSALLRTRMELAVAGLEGSGKTSLVTAIRDGAPATESAPPTPSFLRERKQPTTSAFRGMPKRFMMTARCASGTYLLRSVPMVGK